MGLFKQLIKRITNWNSTKRIESATEFEDEHLFCKALDDDFVIFRREYVKEFLFKDGYKVYLVNVKQAKEDAELDKWADRKEQEQIELNDSLNISLDEKNDRIIRIQEGMDKHNLGDT